MSDNIWRPGDVVRYESERHDRHCREGMALAVERSKDTVILVDTFWNSMSDSHVLTAAEEATAELRFNTADFDALDRHETYRWENYAPTDRQVITSQHGLQRRLFIRKGATEDYVTKVQNAREKLAAAVSELASAERSVQRAKDDLARMQAEQWSVSS